MSQLRRLSVSLLNQEPNVFLRIQDSLDNSMKKPFDPR